MTKKISGAEYPLAKIFSSEFEYKIPSYQRPYAWTIDQASELFDDLHDFYLSEPEEGYFLGSIVLIKQEGIPFAEVIDGQQRLTTLTIFFATIASRMNGDQRETLAKYIKEPGNEFEGLESKPRLTLRERDNEFFEKYVQSLNFGSLFNLDSKSLTESMRNIQLNSKHFAKCLDEKFNGKQEALNEFVKFVLQRCFIVAVSTPSQQSAFRVFSVMNSRGLDLQPTDIVKADVIGKIENDKERNEYSDRWEDMEVELGRAGFNDLFTYIRMIYAKEKAKRALLEEFREHVISNVPSPESLIEDILEPYAYALGITKNANYEASSNAQSVNGYLKWLSRIDNSDWIPPSILFLSQKKDNPGYVVWFFAKLERLAAFMHVCGRNVNERIERYGKIISALEKQHSFDCPISEIELTEKEKSLMKSVLDENIFELPPRRRNYLVLRLDSFLSDGAASYDPAILTIEHVLPQTVSPGSEWEAWWPDSKLREDWVHKMANLVPLNFRRNIKASNWDFSRKKNAYFSGKNNVSSYALTSQVLNTPKWDLKFLEERQEELLTVLEKGWELD